MQDFLAGVSIEDIALYLGVLFAISEALSMIPWVRANGFFQFIFNALKWAKEYVSKMKVGKTMLLVLLIPVMLIAGCASLNLPNDATPAEKRAAMCMDASVSLAMAEAMLSGVLRPTEKVYWDSFRAGASIAVQTYCK